MAKVFVHAAAATAGGGRTYLKNVLPRLKKQGPQHDWHVLLPEASRGEFAALEKELRFCSEPDAEAGGWRRLIFDQLWLGRRLKQEDFDVIIANGQLRTSAPAGSADSFQSKCAVLFGTPWHRIATAAALSPLGGSTPVACARTPRRSAPAN